MDKIQDVIPESKQPELLDTISKGNISMRVGGWALAAPWMRLAEVHVAALRLRSAGPVSTRQARLGSAARDLSVRSRINHRSFGPGWELGGAGAAQ
jgi:hypothetical protein